MNSMKGERNVFTCDCKTAVQGDGRRITSSPELGAPDYEKALCQHDAYIAAMKSCGVEVMVLEADERYPDSCFVEDPAVVTERCAIVTNPGAASRNGEKEEIVGALSCYYPESKIEYITKGTLEGGDVMRVGDHFYIGQSDRTSPEGDCAVHRDSRKIPLHGFGCAASGSAAFKDGD